MRGHNPLGSPASLVESFRAKTKRRRATLSDVPPAPSLSAVQRNDLLPRLALTTIRLDDLRLPTRKLRVCDERRIDVVAFVELSRACSVDPMALFREFVEADVRTNAAGSDRAAGRRRVGKTAKPAR
jgi:hypothetical protein